MSERIAMAGDEMENNSIAKPGKGDRMFLAFLGRARRSEEPPELPSKSKPVNEFVGLGILLLFGGMIALVLWRLFFHAL